MKSSSPIQTLRDATAERLDRLGIDEKEIQETFARSSGPGGQNVNKVATAVSLRWREHEVTVQDSRSQAMNRQIARARLCDVVEEARRNARLARQAEVAKRRARSGKRPAGVKRRILENKRHHSEIKKRRRSDRGQLE